jgi:sortase A
MFVVKMHNLRDLKWGPGILPGYASPGGEGNAVIAGHRDLHFRVLKDVRVGDTVALEDASGQYSYRVFSLEVVNPDDVVALRPERARELTLVTCFPFGFMGSAPKRLLVKAELQRENDAPGGGPSAQVHESSSAGGASN